MDSKILWTISPSKNVNNDFSWEDIKLSNKKDYYITNKQINGFNFLYICLPKGLNFKIYNKLNLLLFDSTDQKDEQLFKIINDDKWLMLRKKDVFNTNNPVTFKITIYND